MTDEFSFDVFLSYSSKDGGLVRTLAEQLRSDGLRVWFDEWELKPGDSIPAKIEQGLEHSRVLALCMSANAFGSDWTELEAHAFRFRDPLNRERRFIPLKLDDAPVKGFLAQFVYIDLRPANHQTEYPRLLEACRPQLKVRETQTEATQGQVAKESLQLGSVATMCAYAFSRDGKRALTVDSDETVRLWDVKEGSCLCTLEAHTDAINCVAWSADQRRALSGADDWTVRLWDVERGRCERILVGHRGYVTSVAWDADERRALSGAIDGTMRLWDVQTGQCLREFGDQGEGIMSLALTRDGRRALCGYIDNTVRLWDVETGLCLRVLEGHTDIVMTVAWSPDERRALSGSHDHTLRLWSTESGRCLRVLEGHTGEVNTLAWSADQRRVLSGAYDGTVRLWDMKTGRCMGVLEGHTSAVRTVAWGENQGHALSGDDDGGIFVWDLSELLAAADEPQAHALAVPPPPDQIQYTNAKVLLVGDTCVGKTGLSMRLALKDWRPTDSTVGAWATHWKLPASSIEGVEREIWLWDFGGQADQRLVHQLYMEDTALAVLVFDGQKDDLFEMLGQWDRDLTRASRKAFTKLLVAGRIDAGGLRVSRTQIDAFAKERGFACFLETSAKADIGCEELKEAILAGIRWADIPWRSSPLLFKRLKEEILHFKDEARVLMRFNELRDALRLRLAGGDGLFKDEELRAVIRLLAGPGVVWEVEFGSWVLLQPERINAYAQAVIQTMRADERERGCLPEEHVLNGNLTYHSSMKRLEPEEERFVLLAMHQALVERGLCLREHTDRGVQLIFPSYYRRERPDLVGHPAVLVSYRFAGFLDDIYATLVVRLHHTKSFEQDQLWRYAADFKTLTGRKLGLKLTRRAEGAGELDVYFDPAIPLEEKIIFSRYVHEHLLQKARDVVRLRHYVCPHCGTVVGNREVAMERLGAWIENKASRHHAPGRRQKVPSTVAETPTIVCSRCEDRVPLWDEMEQWFASPEVQQRVRELQEQSAVVLDSESKERALVGDVISTVALAGQISREFNVSDKGIDMEIEFKDDNGHATGAKLYLQLKSGDSYLRQRKGDGAEVYAIKHERHARYWMSQVFPVLLVVRTSDGELRWMEVRDCLRRESKDGETPPRQIVFKGERFDVMSVRRWRDKVLRRVI